VRRNIRIRFLQRFWYRDVEEPIRMLDSQTYSTSSGHRGFGVESRVLAASRNLRTESRSGFCKNALCSLFLIVRTFYGMSMGGHRSLLICGDFGLSQQPPFPIRCSIHTWPRHILTLCLVYRARLFGIVSVRYPSILWSNGGVTL
jgi:hypothetical protein